MEPAPPAEPKSLQALEWWRRGGEAKRETEACGRRGGEACTREKSQGFGRVAQRTPSMGEGYRALGLLLSYAPPAHVVSMCDGMGLFLEDNYNDSQHSTIGIIKFKQHTLQSFLYNHARTRGSHSHPSFQLILFFFIFLFFLFFSNFYPSLLSEYSLLCTKFPTYPQISFIQFNKKIIIIMFINYFYEKTLLLEE